MTVNSGDAQTGRLLASYILFERTMAFFYDGKNFLMMGRRVLTQQVPHPLKNVLDITGRC